MMYDSVIRWHNEKEYTCHLPDTIIAKFDSIYDYEVAGFGTNYCVSFYAESYISIIKNITGYSLMTDLGAADLKIMCDKLENVIQNTVGIDEVDKVFQLDNRFYNANTRKWIQKLTNMPISSPREIIGLKEIFRICHENNLQLYAYY